MMLLSNKLNIKWRHGEFFVHQSPNLNYSGREVLACLYDRAYWDIEFKVANSKNNGMKKLIQWHHSWAWGVTHTRPGLKSFVNVRGASNLDPRWSVLKFCPNGTSLFRLPFKNKNKKMRLSRASHSGHYYGL